MLLNKTWDFITSHDLIAPGDTVQVGFSGGADSVCLLILLQELGERHGFSVQAVHVNHMLRGQESLEDQLFAERFCMERGIPVHSFSCPVEEIAKKGRIGIEEAGREARTQVFLNCMEQFGADKTALAHHRNDQAETVLFRLARGSSLAGLAGIRPRQGTVIHPLLSAEKEEILTFLEERGIGYRTDSSNLTDHYTRNCIRHRIMPVLKERVNERSLLHIAEAAEDFAETERFIQTLAREAGRRWVVREVDGISVQEGLLREDPVLVRQVLMSVLSEAAGERKNLGREQLSQLTDLLKGRSGRRSSLPEGLEAIRREHDLVIRRKSERPEADPTEEQSVLKLDAPGSYAFGRWKICCTLLPEVPSEIPEKPFTKWLDYDKINRGLEFRTRRAGDFLICTKAGGRKKLKAYLIEEKIPAEKRAEIPLLSSGSRIFWVVGHRISEDCKITEQTERVLQITVSEDKYE